MCEVLQIVAAREFCQLSLDQDKDLKEAVLLATKIFKTPIVALSLLDGDSLTIKQSIGLTHLNLPKVISFCNHTVSQKEIYVIEDTLGVEHFSELVDMPDGKTLRFYAAAPLITQQGLCIGTLCVMDYFPHESTEQDELTLSILAKLVINILEAKLNLSKLDRNFSELERARENAISSEIKLRALFESLTDVYVFLSTSGEILDFNKAAYDYILKFKGKKMIRGEYTANYLNEVDNAAFMAGFNAALSGKRVNQEMLSYAVIAERVWWDSIFEPVWNKNGGIMGVSYIARNINKRKTDSEKILNQNKILKKIAHIHAHEYRGPVCAIRGIMGLIESDNYVASKEYLLMLQKAAKTLDDKTHTVINLISDLKEVSGCQEVETGRSKSH
jgi:PAS domain S-box-containing protein